MLPETGDIRGPVRKESALREVSGYAARPALFRELMGILDADLRLLTPADPGETTVAEGERLWQLTHDHSLLQEQIDSGMLTQEQAKYSLNKNLVTRALGIEAVVPPDISEYRIEAEDIYVLCSDGLTDMVDAEAVREIVATKRSDLAEAAAELIDVANQNGGRDNVSVVLVRVPENFLPTGGWLQRWIAKKPT